MREQILLNAIGMASPAWVSHFANLGPRNIFNRWFKAPGIMTVKDE